MDLLNELLRDFEYNFLPKLIKLLFFKSGIKTLVFYFFLVGVPARDSDDAINCAEIPLSSISSPTMGRGGRL